MLALTCRLGADRYALDAERVVEVVPAVALKAVPGAPAAVAGLLSYRGRVIPVVDLCQVALGRPSGAHLSTRIVVLEYGPRRRVLGLLAEEVTETVDLEVDDLVSSGVGGDGVRYLGAVAVQQQDGSLLQLVEPEALLSDELRASLFADHQEKP